MTKLFNYPKKAAFGRPLPKTKIYEYAGPSTALKKLFVRQVEQITWAYKLAPETINVPASELVSEIQVFGIVLKTKELKMDILRCIDKAIPFPIIYELYYDGQVKAIGAYKRPNETDDKKWVLSEYFETKWLEVGVPRATLPIALDLGDLYGELLGKLISYKPQAGESLQSFVDRAENILAHEKGIAKAQLRLTQEKQFNRKVEINAKIRQLKRDVEGLKKVPK